MASVTYYASVGTFSGMLKALDQVLSKAEANFAERKIDPKYIMTARLAPDMLPFTTQVQFATDHAKAAPSRLTGREAPKFPDTESSFEELKARVARTQDYLSTFKESDFDGAAERRIDMKIGGKEVQVSGADYLFGTAVPNFYFHVTTAYAILRHNGAPIGKGDFLSGRKR